MDNVLRVLHLLEMIRVDLLISDNVLNLFSDPFLYLGMMNKAMNNNTQSGGGGIESCNEKNKGCCHETKLEVFLGEYFSIILVKLIHIYISITSFLLAPVSRLC